MIFALLCGWPRLAAELALRARRPSLPLSSLCGLVAAVGCELRVAGLIWRCPSEQTRRTWVLPLGLSPERQVRERPRLDTIGRPDATLKFRKAAASGGAAPGFPHSYLL